MNGKNYNNRKISCKSCFQSIDSWWTSVDFPNESTDLPTCSGTNISIRNQSTMRTRWQRLQQHISSCCRPWLSAWRMNDFSWRIGSLKPYPPKNNQPHPMSLGIIRLIMILGPPHTASLLSPSPPEKRTTSIHYFLLTWIPLFCRWTSKSHVKSTSNPHQTQLKCS